MSASHSRGSVPLPWVLSGAAPLQRAVGELGIKTQVGCLSQERLASRNSAWAAAGSRLELGEGLGGGTWQPNRAWT